MKLEEDYYLEECPKCGRFNEFLDETCECGQPLHIFPSVSYIEFDEDNE